jgi:hypothetical protein
VGEVLTAMTDIGHVSELLERVLESFQKSNRGVDVVFGDVRADVVDVGSRLFREG